MLVFANKTTYNHNPEDSILKYTPSQKLLILPQEEMLYPAPHQRSLTARIKEKKCDAATC